MTETLLNGGSGSNYKWGQTLSDVTAHVPLNGLRARDLIVDIQRQRIRVVPKRGGNPLLEGALAKPVRCDESTWMIEDGVIVLQLAKDNLRAENTGPSTEWWHGLIAGEDTLDTASVSVSDYVSTAQLTSEQRAALNKTRAREDEVECAKQRAEAALDPRKRDALEKLRAQFPNIPIEWGNTDATGEQLPCDNV